MEKDWIVRPGPDGCGYVNWNATGGIEKRKTDKTADGHKTPLRAIHTAMRHLGSKKMREICKEKGLRRGS